MQKWEYLEFHTIGTIRPATQSMEQTYQYLKDCFPNLGPKDLKIDHRFIKVPVFLWVDILNALGAVGWEAVGFTGVGIDNDKEYLMKRPIS